MPTSAIITAEDASALATLNSGAVDAELEDIYTNITARATAGFFDCTHILSSIGVKAAVINKLTVDLGYAVDVSPETPLSIKISYSSSTT